MSRIVTLAALFVIMTSASARADVFLTPFLGENFGGDAFNCTGLTDCSPRRETYGVSVGAMGTNVGFEEDLSKSRNFFGAAPNTKNSVFSAMSNLLFPAGSSRIQTYIVGGLGLVRASVSLNQATTSSSVLGYDVGGGVNGFFRSHLGIRGDVRHVATFQHLKVPLAPEHLGFWRATLGLVLKF